MKTAHSSLGLLSDDACNICYSRPGAGVVHSYSYHLGQVFETRLSYARFLRRLSETHRG